MNKIGFKNFRRFTDFEPIEFKGITFLVGRNNSGKSTLVKAFLLIIDYLKADKLNALAFNQNNVEDVNIVTFERALNKRAKLNKEEYIEFLLEKDGFRFTLVITGEEGNTEVDVISFYIDDIFNGFSFNIKPMEQSITISTNSTSPEVVPEVEEIRLSELEDKMMDLKISIRGIKEKSSQEYIKLNSELSQLKRKITELRKTIKSLKSQGQFNLESHFNATSLKDVLNEAVADQFTEYGMQFRDLQKGRKPKKIFEALKSFKDNKFKIEKSILSIVEFQSQVENIYLGATLNKQSALFAIRDKRNPLSQAIHEYKQLGIDKDQGSEAYKFVKHWIAESQFEVGDSFDIIMHAGEAYEVIVRSHELEIPLADKGMGSIQAMLLILRLSVIIQKRQTANKKYTVIIEEPELNLHPALQSKLAELFLDVHQRFGIDFIVETHSEYILRKSQVIVAENEFEAVTNENPFCVHYFPGEYEQIPYQLDYQSDGTFDKNFGTGFFDTASLDTLKLLRIKREKKA